MKTSRFAVETSRSTFKVTPLCDKRLMFISSFAHHDEQQPHILWHDLLCLKARTLFYEKRTIFKCLPSVQFPRSHNIFMSMAKIAFPMIIFYCSIKIGLYLSYRELMIATITLREKMDRSPYSCTGKRSLWQAMPYGKKPPFCLCRALITRFWRKSSVKVCAVTMSNICNTTKWCQILWII